MDPEEVYTHMKQSLLLMNEAESDAAFMSSAADLGAAVEALDSWLSRGGFPPKAWNHHIVQPAQGDPYP